MSETIEWHQQCYKNSKGYEIKLRADLIQYIENTEIKIEYLKKQNDFTKLQIDTAVKKKKKSFDSDLFMKKHNPSLKAKL